MGSFEVLTLSPLSVKSGQPQRLLSPPRSRTGAQPKKPRSLIQRSDLWRDHLLPRLVAFRDALQDVARKDGEELRFVIVEIHEAAAGSEILVDRTQLRLTSRVWAVWSGSVSLRRSG